MVDNELKEKILCALKSNIKLLNKNEKYLCRYESYSTKLAIGIPFEDFLSLFFPKYYIEYDGRSIFVTKEEYGEIIKLRKEKVRERQLEELNKLCNNEQ